MIAGGCRCGAVRYTLAYPNVPAIYCCHCLHCQTWSGSAFTEQAMVPASAIDAQGPITPFAMTRSDGAVSTQYLCATCHTRLWNINSKWAGVTALRAGTLDHSALLSPRFHIWVKRKQPWITIAPDIPVFDENAPPARFMMLLAKGNDHD